MFVYEPEMPWLDATALYCPARRERPPAGPLSLEHALDDWAYFYLGYAITTQAELEAFASAYRAAVAAGRAFDGDLEANGIALARLRQPGPGDDADPARIPILIERPLAHLPGASNVLYADGHVEAIKMGAKWPVTQEAIDVLLALDAMAD